jgi:hypothetical protein
LNKNKLALGLFLDINRSFNNASFGSMDAAIGEHGVVLTLPRWINAMLLCRSVRVEIRGSSVREELWNIVVDGLLSRLQNAHYQAQGYADDVVLLQKGKFVCTLCDRM